MADINLAYLSLFVVAIVTLFVFSIIIIVQRKQINYLTTPKYGFMGKPIMVVAMGFIFAGTLGLSLSIYNPSPTRNTDVSVGDNTSNYYIELVATRDSVSRDMFTLSANIRSFSAENFSTDLYWTIEMPGFDKTYLSEDVSTNELVNIITEFPKGESVVTVYFFVGEEKVSAEIKIFNE